MKTAAKTPDQSNAAPSITPAPGPLLQRQCVCGNSAGLDGKCEGCRQKELTGRAAPLIQPKLRIGRPNDTYEREADQVASKVLRMPVPDDPSTRPPPQNQHLSSGIMPPTHVRVQHQVRLKSGVIDDEIIQTKLTSRVKQTVGPDFGSSLDAIQGKGNPLSNSTRSFFEGRFGHDFGQVKIHTGDKASKLARTVNARAFTAGSDIVFDQGEFDPTSSSGQKLLAHELTHVIQQSAVSTQGASGITRDQVSRTGLQIQRRVRSTADSELETQLNFDFNRITALLDELHYDDANEQAVITIMLRWAQQGIAPNGRPYLDKLLAKLVDKRKTAGVSRQLTSYYSLIFNHFDRVGEVRSIVNTYASRTYQGNVETKEASLIEEFGRSKKNFGSFWKKQFDAIESTLREEGTPTLIQNLLGGAVGVLEGFAEMVAELIEGVWSVREALTHIQDTLLFFITGALQETGLKFLKKLPLIGYIFNPVTYKTKFDKTISFFKAAGEALKDPMKLLQMMKNAALKEWDELLADYNAAKDFNKSRIIAKGVVKIGMAVGGFIKNLPNLAKGAASVGRAAVRIGVITAKTIAKAVRGVFQIGGRVVRGTWKVIRETLESGKKRLRYFFKESNSKKSMEIPADEATNYIKCSTCKVTPQAKALEKQSTKGTQGTKGTEPYTRASIGRKQRQELINFWQGKKKRARLPERKEEYQGYIDVLEKRGRPSWRQSELEMEYYYRSIGATAQKGYKHGPRSYWKFKDGKWIPEKGSTRPDIFQATTALEVKNYKIGKYFRPY